MTSPLAPLLPPQVPPPRPEAVDQCMMRDLNGPAVGYCPCCGEYVTRRLHVDDLVVAR